MKALPRYALLVLGVCAGPFELWCCALSNVNPTPVPTPQVGGSSATGGSSARGGSSATTVAEWPMVCDPAARALAPRDLEKLRKSLVQRPKQVRKRKLAHYDSLDLGNLFWMPLAGTLEQEGSSCTGNAFVQFRVSEPWGWSGHTDFFRLETLALDIYHRAQELDDIEGQYPDDTGSTGRAVMMAGKEKGLISRWYEVVTFEGLQNALRSGPCITGTAWWTGMFTPDRCGQVAMTGVIEGYHEWKVTGIHYETKRIAGLNSWGPWGAALRSGQRGFFYVKFGDFVELLKDGDIHCAQVN